MRTEAPRGVAVTDIRRLWPPPGIDSRNHWGFVAGRLGYGPTLARGLVIGIRGARNWAPESHSLRSNPEYDDSFVLLHQNGAIPPALFPGSTHAFQRNSKASPDVNGDGVGDVGTIKPGRFVMHLRTGKYPLFEVTLPDGSKRLPCFRDLDHDGVAEGDAGYTADSILFHLGLDAPADSDHRSSIGCQTASLPWLELMAAEAKSAGQLDYVLATAERILGCVPDYGSLASA
jgi:hypothetical protein